MEKKKAKIAKISEINNAIARASAEADDTVIATSVQYSPKFDIYILGLGTGLHWPDLDVDLYVPALAKGIYGSRDWMKEVGRRGGMVKRLAKADAARKNGLRGGRPRKYS